MQVQMESQEQIAARNQENKKKRQRPAGPSVPDPSEAAKEARRNLQRREEEWLERLVADPSTFAEVEWEVHAQVRADADLYVAGLLAKSSERAEMDDHVARVMDEATAELRPVDKKRRPLMLQLLGGMVVNVMALYAPPKKSADKGGGAKGLYPELAAYRISEGCSPNLQAEVSRLVAVMSIRAAQEELARRGLGMDEKSIHRISGGLGTQMLARRTSELRLFREGKLEVNWEFAGKRIAVQIDGGRVRTRTTVRKSRVGKTRKRRKYRVQWREPKVVTIFVLDDKGRMDRESKAVIDGTLRGPDALIELVAYHLHRLGAAEATEVVFVGDGAKWIWNRLDWVIEKASLKADRVFQVLDWYHCVHHIGLALKDVGLGEAERKECYSRMRKMLKQGRAEALIEELECLADGRPDDSVAWREIRYLWRHADADRLRYMVCRFRKQPLGSGAIESTIRRVINLRLKGNSILWREENAEAIFQLRAALVSGRWDEVVAATRDHVSRNRSTDWDWTPPEALAELNALLEEDNKETELLTAKADEAKAA